MNLSKFLLSFIPLLLFISCSDNFTELNESISGEDMFRSIVLIDGEHVSKIGTYKEALIFLKPLNDEQAMTRENISIDIIDKIRMMDSNFFDEFQRDVSSGNPYVVAEACERAFEYSNRALLEYIEEEGLTEVVNTLKTFDYTSFDLNDPEVRQNVSDSLLASLASYENNGSTDQYVSGRCITFAFLLAATVAILLAAVITVQGVYSSVMAFTEGLAYSNTAAWTTTSVSTSGDGGGGGELGGPGSCTICSSIGPDGGNLIYEITRAFETIN